MSRHVRILALACAVACSAACSPQSDPPAAARPAAQSSPSPAAPGQTQPPLKDVAENRPEYMLGISYPPGIEKYPGLANAIVAYADGERARLVDAVARRGQAGDGLPYDMNLSFVVVTETPQLVVVRADGSRYTGGEHGDPLLRRFVWLPGRGELLTLERLLPRRESWSALVDSLRETLAAQIAERMDGERVAPAMRALAMKQLLPQIEQAVRAEPAALGQFEPVTGADGRIQALRFVFPPFTSDQFVDDQHAADVPATVLLPHVAAPYRPLFAGG